MLHLGQWNSQPRGNHKNISNSHSVHDKVVGDRKITPRDASDPPKGTPGTPRTPQRPTRDVQGLRAVTTKATLSCILGMLSDFGGKTHLRAVTIKATSSCILRMRSGFRASPGPPKDHFRKYVYATSRMHPAHP